jgi:hypothetical protein
MILTQKVDNPIFIPSGANFVEVEAWEYKFSETDENGAYTAKIISRGKRLINLNLVSQLREIELEEKTVQYKRKNANGSWVSDHNFNIVNVTNTKKVYELTRIHDKVNLTALFITFTNKGV